MSTRSISLKEGITYIVFGGIVVFIAVFFGIRSGLAVRSSGVLGITTKNLVNNTSLAIGESVPDMQVYQPGGTPVTLRDLCLEENTVLAFLMPGCGPCSDLLENWSRENTHEKAVDYRIILIAAMEDETEVIEELQGVETLYPVYLCDHATLSMTIGTTIFPTLLGVNEDASIVFVSCGYNNQIKHDFFSDVF